MISVIIPNYNHEKFLEQRIESILNQTVKDLELIILDDCSIDNSIEVINRYKSNPVVKRVEYNRLNSGSVFKQWKKGIDYATGEFIWIAESDDFAEINFLEVMVNLLKENLKAGLVYCNSNIVDADNVIKGTTTEIFQNPLRKRNVDVISIEGTCEVESALSCWCTINNASAVLFRAKSLKNIDIDLKKYFYAGDWATYVAIAKKEEIIYCDKVLSNFRQHVSNSSKKAKKTGRFFLDEYRIVEYCYRNFFETKKLKRDYLLSRYHNLIRVVRHSVSLPLFFKIMLNYFFINPLIAFFYFKEILLSLRRDV